MPASEDRSICACSRETCIQNEPEARKCLGQVETNFWTILTPLRGLLRSRTDRLRAKLIRGLAEGALETFVEIALIREPGFAGNIRDGSGTLAQKAGCIRQPRVI